MTSGTMAARRPIRLGPLQFIYAALFVLVVVPLEMTVLLFVKLVRIVVTVDPCVILKT